MKREYQLILKMKQLSKDYFSGNDTQSSKDFVSLPPKKR